MNNSDIENLVKDILKRLSGMAKRRFKDQYDSAKADLLKFEEAAKKDLVRYTDALSTGQLSPAEYQELIGDNLRLLQMKGLTQAGITLAQVDKFKTAALKVILNAVFKVILPALTKK